MKTSSKNFNLFLYDIKPSDNLKLSHNFLIHIGQPYSLSV